MFPRRYYPDRMFAPRYYPKHGATVNIPTVVEPTAIVLANRGATRVALELAGSTTATLEQSGQTGVDITS